MRIALFVTEDWYVCSHRLPVIRAAVEEGHEVLVITNVNRHAQPILDAGAQLADIGLVRSSARPWTEARALLKLRGLLRDFRPDVLHNVALKPVLYGTAAAALARTPHVVNAMAGLGDLFLGEGTAGRRALRRVLALALTRKRAVVIVQNPDDGDVLAGLGVDRAAIHLIRGAGVDLTAFEPTNEPPAPPIRVLFVGRLLKSKGLEELHAAATALRSTHPDLVIEIAGDRDPHNPGCIDEASLDRWEAEGNLSFLGRREDVADLWAQAHIAVLPSHGEGVPKALLEAAACGRPIIATDVPGNREVVEEGANGMLVPAQDVPALVGALGTLADDPALRQKMGRRSRALAEAEFSDLKSAAATVAIYRSLVQ